MLDRLPIQDVAVMRTVQNAFGAVQNHPYAGTRQGFHAGPEMMEKRLDLPPVDIAADRILENGSYEMFVLVAHGDDSLVGRNP